MSIAPNNGYTISEELQIHYSKAGGTIYAINQFNQLLSLSLELSKISAAHLNLRIGS